MSLITRRSGFAAIPNEAMRDERLSIEARGLLALMMGMGDRWKFRSKDLMKRCKVGKEKYQRMVRELKEAGYLEIVHRQGVDGILDGHNYVLHDCPEGLETRLADNQTDGKPGHLRIPTLKKTNSKTPKPPEGDLFGSDSQQESEIEPKEDPIDVGFEEFWNEIWPSHSRKTGKADCAKVYRLACEGKHKKADKVAPDVLNRCAKAYVASKRGDFTYLKGTLAWLRQPGWEPYLNAVALHQESDLTTRQRTMLQRGRVPPSMQDESGQPNEAARYWLKRYGYGKAA